MRCDDLIAFYDRKAEWDKHWFIGLKIVESALSAGIMGCVGFLSGSLALRLFIACAGASLIVINTMHSICRYHENWRCCRGTCEKLKSEREVFRAHAGIYKEAEEIENLFAERVEFIVEMEHRDWENRRDRASRLD